MKSITFLLHRALALLFFLHAAVCLAQASSLDSLLLELDRTIEEHKTYSDERELRIRNIKNMLTATTDPELRYNLNHMLFGEYKAYICDSAIHYMNQNIELATRMTDLPRLYESRLLLSRLLASTGMYLEATDLLQSIHRSQIPPHLLVNYFAAYNYVYSEASFYTQDATRTGHYRFLSNAYQDSLFAIVDRSSELFLHLHESHLLYSNQTDDAFKINDMRLSNTRFGTPEYAMAAFHRSLIYRRTGNSNLEKSYLALSALSDIRSSLKDHASLWMLAELLYREGDIERAYRYIRFSWSETVFYNARLRSTQSSGILSLIDKTYHARVEQQNRKLQLYLFSISALGLLLGIALLFIYRQMKKLSVVRSSLQQANDRLKLLNEELRQMNQSLSFTNLELSESNQIKEEYIGRFIKLCSTYIDKLDAYRRMVNKKIVAGKTDELYKITRSQERLDDELAELYTNFDTAFLQLFPNFVDQFNKLLEFDEQIYPKKGELLNTELRIFALIRLGINDSSQIAEFLRYSVNTIYNYRAKVKNKACVGREEFEEMVKRIR